MRLSRLFAGWARIARCGEKLGWWVAFQTYVLARLLGRPVRVWLRDPETEFYLRGGATDLGSFASFFMGYPVVRGTKIRTVLDGGANIGDSAVLFAWKYEPDLVLAVEPDAANFAQLQRNTERFPCVVAVQGALWSHDTKVSLHAAEGSTVGSQVKQGNEGDLVSARSIASLAAEHRIVGFDLVKLDIEGAEREVLQSDAASWLMHCRVFILELHDQLAPGAGMALIEAVRKCGPFQVRQIGEYLVFLRTGGDEQLSVSFES